MTPDTPEISLPLNEAEPPVEVPEFEEPPPLIAPDKLRKAISTFFVLVVFVVVVIGVLAMVRTSRAGPEKTVRDFYTALQEGDIGALDACIDWERLILQVDGATFGSLSDAEKKRSLERKKKTLTQMMAKGGAVYNEVHEIEYRIDKVDEGLDVAQVRVLELSRRTGKESLGHVGLVKNNGRWQIYRLNDL